MIRRIRPTLLRLHRYIGLSLAVFLTVAGLTGSIAAFNVALDGWLNPDLFRPRTQGTALSLDDLVAHLRHELPHAEPGYILYRPGPAMTVQAFMQPLTNPATHAPYPLARDEVFVDPATGDIQGARSSTACCLRRQAIIPFLYRFHYSLGLGTTGMWTMGLAALIWSVDCLGALLLTLPPGGAWRRWGRAWRISTLRPSFRLTFDLHRAVSLWLWAVLLGVAFSGFSLALNTQLFRPVVTGLLPTTPPPVWPSPAPRSPGCCDAPAALDRAESLARAAVVARGWKRPPGAVILSNGGDIADFYFIRDAAELGTGFGAPEVTVDARAGRVLAVVMPGQGRAGDLVMQVQFPWHSGQIVGLAGRILVAATGIVVAMLSVTGVMIWQRKRRAAYVSTRRSVAPRRRKLPSRSPIKRGSGGSGWDAP